MSDYIPGALSGIGIETARNIRGVDQMRTAAELAARQFEGIDSDNARYWAGRLREDPRGAFMAAQQYGGVGAVEQALRGAVAQGRATEALGQVMSPAMLAVYQQHGPQGLKALREAQAVGGPDALDSTDANRLRADYTKRSGNFETIRHFYEIASANAAQAAQDPDNPGAVDFALVQAYGKMLDPNSVVMNEEGKFIVDSQSSTARDAINRFARLFSAAGTLNPQARFNLLRQIQATYDKAAERQAGVLEEIDGELDSLGLNGVLREFATPIGIQLSGEALDLAPWERASKLFGSGDREPAAQPPRAGDVRVGQVIDTPRGRVKVVGVSDGGEPLVEPVSE